MVTLDIQEQDLKQKLVWFFSTCAENRLRIKSKAVIPIELKVSRVVGPVISWANKHYVSFTLSSDHRKISITYKSGGEYRTCACEFIPCNNPVYRTVANANLLVAIIRDNSKVSDYERNLFLKGEMSFRNRLQKG